MTQIKQTIIFLAILGFVFIGIAYAISVNMEIGIWSINSNYISNNFLFTCFSGAFASILVLLATEIYRFRQNQKVLLHEISIMKSRISFDITELNAVCDNRFHWNNLENTILNIPDTESSLEAFYLKHKL